MAVGARTERSSGVSHSYSSLFWPRLVRSTPAWAGGPPQRATASRPTFPTATCLNVIRLHFSLSPSAINMETHVHAPVCHTRKKSGSLLCCCASGEEIDYSVFRCVSQSVPRFAGLFKPCRLLRCGLNNVTDCCNNWRNGILTRMM